MRDAWRVIPSGFLRVTPAGCPIRIGSSSFPIGSRHDPAHELVEQRHRECRVSMARTPDHSLGDQQASGRAERRDLPPELLSDVLALAQEGALLITGFTHSQVVYAADLANLCAVVFIKGKRPSEETKRLADQKKMPLLTTSFMMFEACGLLYEYGLKTCAIKTENGKKGK
jgi:hypothetical protein